MTLTENTGDHPSKLQIARLICGELSEDEAATVQAWVDSDSGARAHVAAIAAARSEVAPFSASDLRDRAQAPSASPVQANNNRAFLALIPMMLLAAVALLLAWPALQGTPTDGAVDPTYVATRGSAALQLFHLEAEGLSSYDKRALGEGDVLGFRVVPGGHQGVVVLSVDGDGHVSVFYPESGGEPQPVTGAGPVPLPGSVVLDGAPGPETFIAVFDQSVADARAEVQHTWQSGGRTGLEAWAESSAHVDLAVVNRK